jgi:hypothetical protein
LQTPLCQRVKLVLVAQRPASGKDLCTCYWKSDWYVQTC